MANLAVQYRPTKWEDVAGQDVAVKTIRTAIERCGWGGQCWWITGGSGTGKTTLAMLIAQEGASEFTTSELTASALTPAKLLELEAGYRLRPLPFGGKAGVALVVNECHKLRKDAVPVLLDMLERLPEHVCWLFTTTKVGQQAFFADDETGDTAPLVSRCIPVALSDDMASRAALARRAKVVAMAAGCDGLPEEVYQAAIHSCKGNLRQLLQRVQSGQLAATALAQANDYLGRPFADQTPAARQCYQDMVAQLAGK